MIWTALFRRVKFAAGIMLATPAAVFLCAVPFILAEKASGTLPESQQNALAGVVMIAMFFAIPAFFLLRSARRDARNQQQRATAAAKPQPPTGACPTCGSRGTRWNKAGFWECSHCGGSRA